MTEIVRKTENDRLLRDYQTTVTILEHLSDAVLILNPQGIIQYANRVATDLLGTSLNDLLGKNLNDYLSRPFLFEENPVDNQEERSFLKDIYRSGLREIESHFKTQGYEIPVLLSFGMVQNKNDEVQYIIASAKDLSLRKNLEKERQQKQLLAQSRDRYRELGELAINIVHRLSQPITSIRLLAEMMQKSVKSSEIDSEQLQRNLEQIKEMLSGMSEVINNVRNFAFLTEEETLKPVRLETAIENALQQLHYELTDADFDIRVELPQASFPGVLANALHLQQVFMTLVRYYLGLNERARTLTVRLTNIDNHWIETFVFLGDFPPPNPSRKSGIVDDDINLTIVQLILTSIGGDFSYLQTSESGPAFILRFPADQANDREMLLNLIELMK